MIFKHRPQHGKEQASWTDSPDHTVANSIIQHTLQYQHLTVGGGMGDQVIVKIVLVTVKKTLVRLVPRESKHFTVVKSQQQLSMITGRAG